MIVKMVVMGKEIEEVVVKMEIWSGGSGFWRRMKRKEMEIIGRVM